MKATQDNAVWVSNNYKQGTSEDNWAAVKATVRVPKEPLMVESATTTQATVHAPYGSPGATQDYVLYNPTDGEVSYSVSVNNNVATTLSGDSFVAQGNSTQATYLDGIENAGCGVFTPDGSYAYLKSATGGFWYKFDLASPYKLNNTSNTLDSTFQLTALASEDDAATMMVSYAAGGNYIYLWGRGQVVARYTLTTPYLMETATDLQTYDLTSYLNGLYTSSEDRSGFVGFKVSADGTKGISVVKLWGSTAGNQYIPDYAQGFTLSTPFDLNTIKVTSKGSPLFYDGTNRFINAISVSESGDFIAGVAGDYQSNNIYRSYYLTTPWDVSSAAQVTSEYINTFYTGSDFYNEQMSFLWNPTDDHVYVTSSQGQHYHDTTSMATTGNPYPTATLDYTAAGLTAAPTVIYKDNVKPSDVEYAVLTRDDVDKDGVSLAVSRESTATNLVVFPPMDFQGTTALNNTSLILDGTPVSSGTPTFTNNAISAPPDNTGVPSPTSKGTDLENHATFVGYFQYDDPAVRGGESPSGWTNPNSLAFNDKGTKLFVSGYSGSPNFSSLGGPSSVSKAMAIFDLSTPWDITTKSFNTAISGTTFKGDPTDLSLNYVFQDFCFNNDGTKMFVLHSLSTGPIGYLFEGNLSTPYDPSTWSYNNHIKLSQSTGIVDEDYIYSFSMSEDGKLLKIFHSTTTGATDSTNYCRSQRVRLTTPFTLSSAVYVGQWSSGSDYRGGVTGDETYGYYGYAIESSDTGHRYNIINVSTVSSDLTSAVFAASDQFDLSLGVENWVDSALWTRAGKTILADNGTKLFIHFPEVHRIAMFTGPFGAFQDKYEVDISSLGLSDQPTNVTFYVPDTYTSMGSTSLSTNANLYKEYSTPEVSIDAEALRFKIEGDTDATVTRFNADLFT